MRRQLHVVLVLALTACAGFERKVSVQNPEIEGLGRTVRPAGSVPKERATASHEYRVVRGDTLYGIAFRNHLDYRDLAAWNGIAAPFTIYPGQVLRLRPPEGWRHDRTPAPDKTLDASNRDPSTTRTFPVADPNAPITVVTPTDSTRREAKPSKVELARESRGISSPAAAIGLPATAPKPAPDRARSSAEKQQESASAKPFSAESSSVASTPPDAMPQSAVANQAPTRERDGLQWRWPTDGRLLGRFVEGDPTQQGIDIGGRLGQPVLAAADGDVVYSGNGLIGYGELIIIQHSPGYLSAYGHNRKRLVVEGEKVKAGQPIAEMGRRGGIDMLHFEIRRNGKPVDPLAYLPKR